MLGRDALTRALGEAAARFGGSDVLEYSPVGTFGVTAPTAPSETEPSHVRYEMEFQLYGAMAATRAVLPAMREAGSGTLLYTTGAGSIVPDPRGAHVNAAAAALRNWAAGTGGVVVARRTRTCVAPRRLTPEPGRPLPTRESPAPGPPRARSGPPPRPPTGGPGRGGRW